MKYEYNVWAKCIFFMIVWLCIVTDSLWIKPTDALDSNFIGITTIYVSGILSAHHREFLAYIGFGTFYTVVMNRLLPGLADVRLRTPGDGQKGCPKHVE